MKKVLLATAVFIALGSSSVMAVEGGRINFEGLVSAETCKKSSAPLLVIAISTVRLL